MCSHCPCLSLYVHSDISTRFDHWNNGRHTGFQCFCRITVTDGYIANRSRRTRCNKQVLLHCPESEPWLVVCVPLLSTVPNHWDWVSRDFSHVSRSPLFSCESLHTLKLTRLGTFSHTGERSVGTRHCKCTSVVHTVDPWPPPRSLQSSLLSFGDEIHWISRGKTGKVKENDWKWRRLDTDGSELKSYEKRCRHCEAKQGLYHIRCMANHL